MLKPSGQRLRRVTLLDGCVCKQVGAPKPQRAWTELRDLAVAETPSRLGYNAHFRRWAPTSWAVATTVVATTTERSMKTSVADAMETRRERIGKGKKKEPYWVGP